MIGHPRMRAWNFIIVGGIERGDQAPLVGEIALELLAYPVAQPAVVGHLCDGSGKIVPHFVGIRGPGAGARSLVGTIHMDGVGTGGKLPDNHSVIGGGNGESIEEPR